MTLGALKAARPSREIDVAILRERESERRVRRGEDARHNDSFASRANGPRRSCPCFAVQLRTQRQHKRLRRGTAT